MIQFDPDRGPLYVPDNYYTETGDIMSPEAVEERKQYDQVMANPDAFKLIGSIPTQFYDLTDQQRLYRQVASGGVQLKPEEFNRLFSDEDLAMSEGEFNLLPPEVQEAARQNPQLFMQSVLSNTANKDHGDLMSVGAEGGFSDYSTTKWDPVLGLVPDQSKYMQIHDEPDWGLYATLALIGGAAGAGSGLFGPAAQSAVTGVEAGAGAAGAAEAGVTAAEFAAADAAQLAAQGFSQGEIAAIMAGNSVPATGGVFVGTGGFIPSTSNALADAALNGAVRGGLTSAVTGGNPVSGALMGGVSGGWGQAVGDLGNPVVNGVVRAVPRAVFSGSATPLVTGGVGSGVSSLGRELGLGGALSNTLGTTAATATGVAMRPEPPQRPQRAISAQSSAPVQTHPIYGRMIPL